MQTILGSGGIIATELAKELTTYTKDIRLVSRNPKKVNETDQLLKADLLNATEVEKAVEGSEIVYVTIGFPYNAKVWQQTAGGPADRQLYGAQIGTEERD